RRGRRPSGPDSPLPGPGPPCPPQGPPPGPPAVPPPRPGRPGLHRHTPRRTGRRLRQLAARGAGCLRRRPTRGRRDQQGLPRQAAGQHRSRPEALMRRSSRPLGVMFLTLLILAAACSAPKTDTGTQSPGVSQAADAALAKIQGQVLSKGPNGEDPAPASEAELTPEEGTQVKGLGAKAAIVMHYGGNDWATAQIDGLKSEFGKLGIDVVATTDANFKPDKQVSDIETVLSQKPDI